MAVQMQINKLLQTVVNKKGSDLLLTVGCKPMLRLNGRLIPLQTKVLDDEDTVALMKSITSDRSQQELQEVGSSDFSFTFGEQARFRVSVFKQRGHTAVAMRLIPNRIMSFEEIGLSDNIKKLLWRPRGMILVTGPTGSGKSTTLATMVDFINTQRDLHIITIEDPIEYYHEHKRSVITQRELGVDVPSFSEGLRRALRQDPDVILVGEMRDLETMETAISAAETGHLVFATLHTNSAETSINRIVDAFPPQQQEQVRIQLASNLLAVVCEALIPDTTGQGRVAAFEVMVSTPAIRNLIRQQKVHQLESEIQTGSKYGMILLDDFLAGLCRAGRISDEEALNRCRNVQEMMSKLRMVAEEVEAQEAVVPAVARARPTGRQPSVQIESAARLTQKDK